MSAARLERPTGCTPVSEANFITEVQDLAKFYGGRIPLAWQDALQGLLDTIDKDRNDAD